MNLIYNPPSLRLECACSIRQSMSCIGKDIANNLIKKLAAGDLDDLRNRNVPISLEDMCKYYNVQLQTLKAVCT